MSFEDSFRVDVPREVAWEALTDIERVYPCLPGAELEEVRDGEFRGRVRLKMGPITASYSGTARFESIDAEAGELVIHATGRDRHGQGTATARVRAAVSAEGSGTLVAMTNEIDITGKAAQFGRGVLVDVSKQMMGQFATCLESTLSSSSDPSTVVTESGAPTTEDAHREASVEAAPMDVGSLLKPLVRSRASRLAEPRFALSAATVVVVVVLLVRRRRR